MKCPKCGTDVSQRSSQQNRTYWGVWLKELSDDTGNDVDVLHEFFKRKFLGFKEVEFRGVFMRIPKSTTDLSTKEFAEFCDRVRAWAGTELGIVLTEPGERK